MPLTTPQLQTLKTWLLANAQAMTDEQARDALNAQATPAFTVWKTNVTIREIGDNMVGTDLAGLTSLNHTRLLTVVTISTAGVNPSLSDRRAFFDDIFSGAGGAATRAKLLILWKRLAKLVEKLLATGTGSDASPATLVFEGSVTTQDVINALNS